MKFPTDEGYLMKVFLKTGMEDVMSFSEWKERADPQHNLKLCDGWLEMAWEALGDVPTKDTDNDWILDERFETPWVTFEKGVSVMDVWRWFDKKHSKGVHWLMYGVEKPKGKSRKEKKHGTVLPRRR